MTLPASLADATALRAAFEGGLAAMLAGHHDLGVFILVLANAVMDDALRARLEPALAARFEALRARPPAATADDEAVFAALRERGWRDIESVVGRHVAGFELQCNALRGLRPPRNAGSRIDTLAKPFDPDGFHFAKPFLREEIFWQGDLLGRDVALLYNKFPFLPTHALLVPEADAGHAQLLTHAWHDYLWRVSAELGERIPGIGFGFNAYGAYASVNHLHFQMFVRPDPLPVAAPHWAHNGGADEYPTGCLRFDDAGQAWTALADLHAANVTYNLVYLPGRLYCLPRAFQGTRELPVWSQGHAFYEMAGGLTVFERAAFDALTATELRAALARQRVE
ncbi:MAG: hypothetical protein H6926_07685 [Chromatiales bacterium]|nr:hypothetical protein [Chromatiales bacterium]